MKKLISLILLITVSSISAEIIESMPVGPGVMYYHDYRSEGPWHLHVMEIDLTNEWVKLESVKANNVIKALERTSSMASRNDTEEHKVVGAINGDFYDTGTHIPVNGQVVNGKLVKRPNHWPAFAITDNGLPLIQTFIYSGQLFKDSISCGINGVNEARLENYMVVYNSFNGSKTGSNEWGAEVLAKYITSPLVNDTVLVKIIEMDTIVGTGHGNNTIPSNGLVFSGHGTSAAYLKQFAIGDTLQYVLGLSANEEKIMQHIGGYPMMITGGDIVKTNTNAFSTDRHPRTAIGFSQDSSKVYMVVVDGRQTGYSVGMSLYELGNYMLEWNVFQAVNLDGGGSSTMVIKNKVANSPSDGSGERSVTNGLMVVSTSPTSDFDNLWISPRKVYLLTETSKQFNIKAFDQYYNSLPVPEDIVWSCDPSLGTFNSNGFFTASSDTAAGYVYATSGDAKDSAQVLVTAVGNIELSPDPIILEVDENQQIKATAYDYFGNIIDLANTEYQWSITSEIGTINETGYFTSSKIGEAYIIAETKGIVDSVAVMVGSATTILVENFNNLDDWSISGVRIDLNNSSFAVSNSLYYSEPSSGKLQYVLQTGGVSAMYLNCNLPISGTPDAFGLYVYGDDKGHWLRGEFIDKDGEKFLVDFTEPDPGIDWKDEWKYLEIILADASASWANPSAVLDYPITWKKIYLAETSDDKKDSGTIYLDDFSIRFINGPQGIEEEILAQADNFNLISHYPNPFNNSSKFKFRINKMGNIKITFYDINGRIVDKLVLNNQKTGVNEYPWTPFNLSSGIYMYTIEMNGQLVSGKCLLIK
jgi:hypothetical protein